MKSNAIKLLTLTAAVGLIAGQAQANTESSYKKNSSTTTTYGTGTESSKTYGETPTTTYGTGSDTTLETTGAPRVKTTSKTTTTESTSPGVLDQSSGTAQDVEVTRMIRDGLNSNSSLSTSAKNVEVITLNNVITLKGKVASQAEKDQVASVARNAAGNRAVHNELVIDTSKR